MCCADRKKEERSLGDSRDRFSLLGGMEVIRFFVG